MILPIRLVSFVIVLIASPNYKHAYGKNWSDPIIINTSQGLAQCGPIDALGRRRCAALSNFKSALSDASYACDESCTCEDSRLKSRRSRRRIKGKKKKKVKKSRFPKKSDVLQKFQAAINALKHTLPQRKPDPIKISDDLDLWSDISLPGVGLEDSVSDISLKSIDTSTPGDFKPKKPKDNKSNQTKDPEEIPEHISEKPETFPELIEKGHKYLEEMVNTPLYSLTVPIRYTLAMHESLKIIPTIVNSCESLLRNYLAKNDTWEDINIFFERLFGDAKQKESEGLTTYEFKIAQHELKSLRTTATIFRFALEDMKKEEVSEKATAHLKKVLEDKENTYEWYAELVKALYSLDCVEKMVPEVEKTFRIHTDLTAREDGSVEILPVVDSHSFIAHLTEFKSFLQEFIKDPDEVHRSFSFYSHAFHQSLHMLASIAGHPKSMVRAYFAAEPRWKLIEQFIEPFMAALRLTVTSHPYTIEFQAEKRSVEEIDKLIGYILYDMNFFNISKPALDYLSTIRTDMGRQNWRKTLEVTMSRVIDDKKEAFLALEQYEKVVRAHNRELAGLGPEEEETDLMKKREKEREEREKRKLFQVLPVIKFGEFLADLASFQSNVAKLTNERKEGRATEVTCKAAACHSFYQALHMIPALVSNVDSELTKFLLIPGKLEDLKDFATYFVRDLSQLRPPKFQQVLMNPDLNGNASETVFHVLSRFRRAVAGSYGIQQKVTKYFWEIQQLSPGRPNLWWEALIPIIRKRYEEMRSRNSDPLAFLTKPDNMDLSIVDEDQVESKSLNLNQNSEVKPSKPANLEKIYYVTPKPMKELYSECSTKLTSVINETMFLSQLDGLLVILKDLRKNPKNIGLSEQFHFYESALIQLFHMLPYFIKNPNNASHRKIKDKVPRKQMYRFLAEVITIKLEDKSNKKVLMNFPHLVKASLDSGKSPLDEILELIEAVQKDSTDFSTLRYAIENLKRIRDTPSITMHDWRKEISSILKNL